MIGIVMTTAAAAIDPVGASNAELPVKKAIAAGTVRDLVVDVSEIANRKSFQQKMNTRIAVVNMPGAASGAMTLVNAWNGVAPSIFAAFSSSHGMYGMISAGHVSNRPIARSMLNSGVTSEIAGNIAISKDIPISTPLPGNSSRATAYAAIEASTTAITVEISAMPMELISAWVNSDVLKMPR